MGLLMVSIKSTCTEGRFMIMLRLIMSMVYALNSCRSILHNSTGDQLFLRTYDTVYYCQYVRDAVSSERLEVFLNVICPVRGPYAALRLCQLGLLGMIDVDSFDHWISFPSQNPRGSLADGMDEVDLHGGKVHDN